MRKNRTVERFLRVWSDKTIAVVGSGKFNKKYGEEIDSHDVVIRFNDAPTIGYEKYVGGKTNFRCASCTHLIDTLYKLPQYADDIIFILSRRVVDMPVTNNAYTTMITYDRELKGIKVFRPTIGFQMLFLLYLYDLKCDVYGFDFQKSGHYYDEIDFSKELQMDKKAKKIMESTGKHEPDKEESFWLWTKYHNFK